jgi:hypothetical protein
MTHNLFVVYCLKGNEMNKESKKPQSPKCKGASIEGSFDDLTDAIGKLKKPVDKAEDKKNEKSDSY